MLVYLTTEKKKPHTFFSKDTMVLNTTGKMLKHTSIFIRQNIFEI